MAYDYLWTPSTARPTADSTVKIENWDGEPVPDATFTFSSRQIKVTVQEKGRYKLSIRSGSQAESATVNIPAVGDNTSLYERVNTLETRPVADALHTHAISDVTNLQTSLDAKAALAHAHAIGDVTNLQASLDGKAASVHGHAIGDVTNLQASLDAKQATLQDTGWRSMPLGTGIGGTVLMRRFGQTVHVNLVGVTAGTAGDQLLAATPVGFQGTAHSVNVNTFIGRMLSSTTDLHLVYNSTNTALYGLGMEATTSTATVAYNGSGVYFTTDPFPTTLPGTAV